MRLTFTSPTPHFGLIHASYISDIPQIPSGSGDAMKLNPSSATIVAGGPDQWAQAKADDGLVVEWAHGPPAQLRRPAFNPATCWWRPTATRLHSIEQIKLVLQGRPTSVALLVQRDGKNIFVPVNLR